MEIQKNDYYESNLALLKLYHKRVWEDLQSYQASFHTEVFSSSDGKLNLKLKNGDNDLVSLHDETDPEKEIPQFLDMIEEDATGVVLLTGMGLGYTPMAILRERKHVQHLVLFDLIPDIFVQSMKHMDLSSLLSDPRLTLGIGPEPDIESVLEPIQLSLQLESIHNLKHIPTFSIDKNRYETFNEKLFTIANQHNLGGGAILRGGRAYTDNRLKNLTTMYKNKIIEDLKGRFAGIPAILVAGGPSLDMDIHLLSELKDRAVIIAVDSTLPALVANGVSPDFMTAIDPYDLIYEKFSEALPDMGDTSLIASAWVAPKVAKVFPPKQIFWTFAGRNMENWMQSMMGGHMPSGGASTVAHLNLVAAIIMGCSPIVFIGQDLAYTGRASHASNTALTFNKEMKDLFAEKKDLLWQKGVDGGKVPTDRILLNFKRHFEDLIENNPGIYINATAQGAHIEGTVPMELEEVIATHCTEKKNIRDIIAVKDGEAKEPDLFIKEFRSFIHKSKSLVKEINTLEGLQKKVVKTLSGPAFKYNIHKRFDSLPDGLKKQINKIDKSHKKIDSRLFIWGILDEITMAGLQASERQKHTIKQLQDKPEKYIEWLLKNFERLNLVNTVRKRELIYFREALETLLNHFETEKKKRRDLKQRDKKRQALLDLAKIYFKTGDYSLLEEICLEFENSFGNSSEFKFYSGVVANLKTDFKKGEAFFNQGKQDPAIKKKISDFRARMANEYIGHADFFIGKDDGTVRKMLIRGIKYSAGNSLILSRINAQLDADMKRIETALESEDMQEERSIVENWIKDIETHNALKTVMDQRKCASLYRMSGSICVKEGRLERAIENFDNALLFSDDDPQIYLLKADACFAVEKYDCGIDSLNRAVALDKRYAQYWENMGDNLVEKGAFGDALAAYEQNILAAPENKMILKKIAKCYLALGQTEAANEALYQLRKVQ